MKYALSFYIIIVFIYSNSLCGMDLAIEYGEARKKLLVLSIIINNKEVVDHQTICSLAICKECDNDLKKTASQKKEYILSQYSKKILPNGVWHKYGSAFIALMQKKTKSRKVLYGRLNRGFKKCYIETLPVNIPGLEKPFFDAQGKGYFYGLKKTDRFRQWFLPEDIVEYCINNDSVSGNLLKVRIGDGSIWGVARFLSLPNLLKAFLCVENDVNNCCDINTIIIPDNYKDFVKYRPEYASFDNLPTALIMAINDRYKQQSENRNKNCDSITLK